MSRSVHSLRSHKHFQILENQKLLRGKRGISMRFRLMSTLKKYFLYTRSVNTTMLKVIIHLQSEIDFLFVSEKSLFFWLNICALHCSYSLSIHLPFLFFSFYSYFFQNFIILLVCLFAHCSINRYHHALPHGTRTFCLSNFPPVYSSTFPSCSAGGGWCGGDVRPATRRPHTHTPRPPPRPRCAGARRRRRHS